VAALHHNFVAQNTGFTQNTYLLVAIELILSIMQELLLAIIIMSNNITFAKLSNKYSIQQSRNNK